MSQDKKSSANITTKLDPSLLQGILQAVQGDPSRRTHGANASEFRLVRTILINQEALWEIDALDFLRDGLGMVLVKLRPTACATLKFIFQSPLGLSCCSKWPLGSIGEVLEAHSQIKWLTPIARPTTA